ncbi:MAG: hypothetical protein NTV52_08045 [Acidobacteria bacterium]|nr:hypothetical protein [Acidobacteriota bacterium]
MRAGFSPATQAAVPSSRPAAAPVVTMPASAPVMRPMTRLAAACSSAMSTHWVAASAMAAMTSGARKPPETRVEGPLALMIRGTPRSE